MIPLFQIPTSRVHEAVRNVVPAPSDLHLERGGLVARGVALAAAIAVSLLAVSGAGGSAAQTPKRGGTVVSRPIHREPACLNPFLALRAVGCDLDARLVDYPGSRRRRSRPAPDFSCGRISSPRGHREEASFRLTYHIRPERGGATEFRSAPTTSCSPRAQFRSLDPRTSRARRAVRVASPCARREDVSGVVLRPHYADWRALFGPSCRATRSAGVDIEKVWIDRIDNPKTGAADRQRAVSLSRAGSAASGSRSSEPSVLGAAHRAISTASSLSFGTAGPARPARGFRRWASSTSSWRAFVRAEFPRRRCVRSPGSARRRVADDGDGALRVSR